jgi:TrmH family RNA methyltransferase
MLPISKAKSKLIRSLHQKKFRFKEGLYLAPGRKILEEALQNSQDIEWVICREGETLDGFEGIDSEKTFSADEKTFRELSGQVNPEGVLTVLRIPGPEQFLNVNSADEMPSIDGHALLLDDIRDPGNLGTLIRTADWMGFEAIVCSAGTVDVFNAKVLRSSMGSVFRVRIIYLKEFVSWVEKVAESVWVADLDGEAADRMNMSERPFLLLGNEANGVSEELRGVSGICKVHIPQFGGGESLNVAASGAILSWEMKRKR